MNVSLHLHRAERPAVTCSTLTTGNACLTVSATKGEFAVFGTREQVCELLEAILAAIYPESIDEADFCNQG